MGFEEAVAKVKEVLDGISTPRPANDIVIAKTMFAALGNVLEECKDADIAVLIANVNLSVLEEACSGKFVLSCSLQTLLVSIYCSIVLRAPGYAVRNIAVNYLALCSSKSAAISCKVCALSVCAAILGTRSFDCGSMISETVLSMTKTVKGADTQLRLGALKVLIAVVNDAGTRIGDCHPDILKVAVKCVLDKSSEVRQSAAVLIVSIAKNSNGCTSVSAELLLSSIGKGLEDEVAAVQDLYTRAVASVFSEQIKAFAASQEQAKIGLARGVSVPPEAAKPKRRLMSKLASAVTTQRKIVEDYQFRSVVTHLVKALTKAGTPSLRAANIAVLGHLIRDCLEDVDEKDFEWLIDTIVKTFADPVFVSLKYEDSMLFRTRMSHLLRYSVTSNLSEQRQTVLANLLVQSLSAIEARTENELQYSLGELSHVLLCLGDAAVSVIDAVHAAVTVHIRHPSFIVRSAAAYVLATSAASTPIIASTFLRTALINADIQAKQLTQYDDGPEDANPIKNVREQEKLQRMFFFHGHTLALSIFLRNEGRQNVRIPRQLLVDCLDFGLELLHQDCLNSSLSVRHIRCSLVRAGSLIVSSCLCTSHNIAGLRLLNILQCCNNLFKLTLGPALNDDMVMYEIMTVEAASVCVSTLIWTNPGLFIQDMETLPVVIEGLEMALRAIKGKYQKFKTHFRFRTLHVILLECFSWLPPGSCSNSMQPLFVEALRVLRDSISLGLECNCLIKKAESPPLSRGLPPHSSLEDLLRAVPIDDFSPLNVTASHSVKHVGVSHSLVTVELPLTEHALMLKLESNAQALNKKESEAFLVTCGDQSSSSPTISSSRVAAVFPGVQWVQSFSPSAVLDSRTVNCSISLVAATFGYQTIEFQEKAITFFSQTLLPFFAKQTSSGMFGSEEEKKKKERRSLVVITSVLAALNSIVASLPCVPGEPLVTVWGQILVDSLYDLLAHSNTDIREMSASTLASFCSICSGGGRVESVPYDSNVRFSVVRSPSGEIRGEEPFLEERERNEDEKVRHEEGNRTDDCSDDEVLVPRVEEGAWLVESCLGRLSAGLSSAFEKKGDPLTDCGGLVLCLSQLWGRARGLHPLQQNIFATVLDSLRKVDGSMAFKSHCLTALSAILSLKLRELVSFTADTPPLNTEDLGMDLDSLTERVFHIAEIHLCSLGNSAAGNEDSDQLLVTLQRLLSISASLLLYSQRSKKHPAHPAQTLDLYPRYVRMWTIISRACSHPWGRRETVRYAVLTSHFQSDIQETRRALCLFKETIDSRASLDSDTLHLAVSGVAVVVGTHPELVLQEGLGVALFELLDWCVACTPATTYTAHVGIELLPSTRDMPPSSVSNVPSGNRLGSKHSQNDGNASLQHVTEDALLELSRAIVRHGTDKYVTHWILFCRAVALSLRASAGQSGGPGPQTPGALRGDDEGGEGGDDQVDTEDGFVITPPEPRHTPSKGDKGDKAAGSGLTPLSYQQYATWCRDQAVSKVQGLPVIVRVRVKCVAVQCAAESIVRLISLQNSSGDGKQSRTSGQTEASTGEKGEGGSQDIGSILTPPPISPCHTDLGLARTSTQSALRNNQQSDPGSFLSEIPCYLSLFIPDIVTLACACATFTIDDSRILGLQRVSLLLLRGVLDLFSRSLDPDSDSTQDGQTKVLSQFITQFVSAIRPYLGMSGSPSLLETAGEITITLIKEGLLTDKVVLRRLVKTLLLPDEASSSAREISSAGDVRSVRAPVSLDLNEETCALDHLTKAYLAAQLFLLTGDEVKATRSSSNNSSSSGGSDEKDPGVSVEVRACIDVAMKVQVPRLQLLWAAVSLDAARVLQSKGSRGERGADREGDGGMTFGGERAQEGGEVTLANRSVDAADRYAPPSATEGREPPAPVTRGGKGSDLASLVSLSSSSLDVDSAHPVCVVRTDNDNNGHTPHSAYSAFSPLCAPQTALWPPSSPHTDPRRGGITYSPSVSPLVLREGLERFLPPLLAASALALSSDCNAQDNTNCIASLRTGINIGTNDNDITDCSDAGSVFAMSVTALAERVKRVRARKGVLSDGTDSDIAAISTLMAGLSSLSALPLAPSSSSRKGSSKRGGTGRSSDVPLPQWTRLLSFLAKTLLPLDTQLFSEGQALRSGGIELSAPLSCSVLVKVIGIMHSLQRGLSRMTDERRKRKGENKDQEGDDSEGKEGAGAAHIDEGDSGEGESRLRTLLLAVTLFLLCSIFPLCSPGTHGSDEDGDRGDRDRRDRDADMLRSILAGQLPHIQPPHVPPRAVLSPLLSVLERLQGHVLHRTDTGAGSSDSREGSDVVCVLLSVLSGLTSEMHAISSSPSSSSSAALCFSSPTLSHDAVLLFVQRVFLSLLPLSSLLRSPRLETHLISSLVQVLALDLTPTGDSTPSGAEGSMDRERERGRGERASKFFGESLTLWQQAICNNSSTSRLIHHSSSDKSEQQSLLARDTALSVLAPIVRALLNWAYVHSDTQDPGPWMPWQVASILLQSGHDPAPPEEEVKEEEEEEEEEDAFSGIKDRGKMLHNPLKNQFKAGLLSALLRAVQDGPSPLLLPLSELRGWDGGAEGERVGAAQGLRQALLSSVCPALLCLVSPPPCSPSLPSSDGVGEGEDECSQLLAVHLLFGALPVISKTHRASFVAVILPPICDFLCQVSAGSPTATTADTLLQCGQALTQMARSCSDAFRGSVGSLSEQHRSQLQSVMRNALQQPSSSSGVGPLSSNSSFNSSASAAASSATSGPNPRVSGVTAGPPPPSDMSPPVQGLKFDISKFKNSASAAVARPVGTFTRVTLTKQSSSGSMGSIGNGNDEGDGVEGEGDGGYGASVSTGGDSP